MPESSSFNPSVADRNVAAALDILAAGSGIAAMAVSPFSGG